jgi:hypothetical protein
MKLDFYTKTMLTVIAICLVVLTVRTVSIVAEVRASTTIFCSGDLKAKPQGATAASWGGYAVDIKCN